MMILMMIILVHLVQIDQNHHQDLQVDLEVILKQKIYQLKLKEKNYQFINIKIKLLKLLKIIK